jgi:DNA-binding Xre family transcriptional regulator
MATKTIFSERLVKSRAAYLQKSLADVNEQSGLGNGYIYRLWDSDNVMLKTVNRIAEVLGCKACDLLEDVDERELDARKWKPPEWGSYKTGDEN